MSGRQEKPSDNGSVVRSLILIAGFITAATPAQAQPAQVVGESGGKYFEFGCGPGKVLVGMRGSAGVLIDNLQAICGRVTEEGGFADATPMGPLIGHARPQDRHVECPAGYGVTDAQVGRSNDHPYLVAIDLSCVELVNRTDGGRTKLEFRGSGNLYGYSGGIGVGESAGGFAGLSSCEGKYAIGIRGRAEQYISAFGLICGNAVAERTLNKRKKPTLNLRRHPGESATSSIPGAQRTLNKRRRPVQPGDAASNPNPAPGQAVGVSVFTDSGLPPAPADNMPAAAPEVSPLIAGEYSTQMVIRESRCIQPVSGSWQQMIALEARPVLVIPIHQFSNVFAGPLQLRVNGTSLSQTASVPLDLGVVRGDYPTQMTGGFDPDFRRFEVRFDVNAPLCNFNGVIIGTKP